MVLSGVLSQSRPGQLLGNYLAMVKPGIVLGNLVTLAGGFFLAARGAVDFTLLLETTLGLALVVASGCAVNNVIDRDIDGVMQRTRGRPMVRGALSSQNGLVFAGLIGLAGFTQLAVATNTLTTLIAAIGYVIYVGVYSLYMKRHSIYGSLVGSLSGAVPPVVGYCAVTGRFDLAAFLLLAIFSCWQIPHFHAIAVSRLQDYKSAGIPVWPAVKGFGSTKRQTEIYVVGFTAAALALAIAGYAGRVYELAMLALGGYWLYLARSVAADQRAWARRLFLYSIVVVLATSVALALDYT
jgi:protoheme IX farnesyltransferase